MDPDIAELSRAIARARRAVVFTGAGISTESGIPDFRSPGGIWTRMPPIDFSEFLASAEARRETWRRRFAMEETFRAAAPNRGHRAVAALVRRGTATAVITQNIDGLHQASGIPDERVIELHGNTTYAHCLDCKTRYELDALRIAFERNETPPLCDECGGLVKTATISFGQAMPSGAMQRISAEPIREISQNTLLFRAGGVARTNCSVGPVAQSTPTAAPRVSPIERLRTRSAIASRPVGSRLMITKVASLCFASSGKAAAG